jgi:hypothetical protein
MLDLLVDAVANVRLASEGNFHVLEARPFGIVIGANG